MNHLPSMEVITAQNELDYAKAALHGPHRSPEEAAAVSMAVQTAQERLDAARQRPSVIDLQTACKEAQTAYDAMNPHKKGV